MDGFGFADKCVLLKFPVTDKEYDSHGHKIVVTRESLEAFPLVDKITLRDKDGRTFFNINLTINEVSVCFFDTRDQQIECVELFVSKAFPDKPLVIGINSNKEMKYYRYSKLKMVFEHAYVFMVKASENFIDALIDENDHLNGTLTFRIDQKKSYNNISVEPKVFKSHNFSKLSHTPRRKSKDKKSLVVNIVHGTIDEVIVTGSLSTLTNHKIDNIVVYFNPNSKYKDVPLLIRVTKGKNTYFFDRKTATEMVWRQIQIVDGNRNPDKIERRLESIYRRLFQTMTVLIHKQSEYAMLTIEDSRAMMYDKPDPRTKISVTQKNCPNIGDDYVCYQHDLTLYKDTLKKQIDGKKIGRANPSDTIYLIVYIFNVGINTYMKAVGSSSAQGDSTYEDEDKHLITYDGKNNYLNVFFYKNKNKSKDGNIDSIPLMFQYNNLWYRPLDINSYFYEWFKVDELTVTDPTTCNAAEAVNIKKHLDEVNRMINRINLNYKITSKPLVVSSDTSRQVGKYGIPAPYYLKPSFDVSRIMVTCTRFPDDPMFTSYIHKTINGYDIGDSYYRTKESVGGGARTGDGQPTPSVGLTSSGQSNSNTYYTHLYNNRIRGIEEDLDGKVDVTANAVTVYFFNEDKNNNYPLMAEYVDASNKYQYFVLKHAMDNRALVSTS